MYVIGGLALLCAVLIGFYIVNGFNARSGEKEQTIAGDPVVMMIAGASNSGLLYKEGGALLIEQFEAQTGKKLILGVTSEGGSAVVKRMKGKTNAEKLWSTAAGGILSEGLLENLKTLYLDTKAQSPSIRSVSILWHNGTDQFALYQDKTLTEAEYKTALTGMLDEWQRFAEANDFELTAFLIDPATDPTVEPSAETARFREIDAEVFTSHPIGNIGTEGTTEEILSEYAKCTTDACRVKWFGRDGSSDDGFGVHWGSSAVRLIIERLADTLSESALER